MQHALKILAYWVVFGLPLLMIWRFYQLAKTKNKPKTYYIGSIILYLGIAVWIPFAYFRRILDMHISVFPFLITHLIGTGLGAYMRRLQAKSVSS